MQAASSIYIREDLKIQLTNLKRNPKESYNDVIERLVNFSIDDELLSADAIKGLEEKQWIERTRHGGMFRFYNKYKLTGKYDFLR